MPLGFPTAGCCGSCDANGAPNSITVSLSGFTGNYSACNGGWVCYASAWSNLGCTYRLKYGPPRPDPLVVDEGGVNPLLDYRASVQAVITGTTITVTLIDGTPAGNAGSGPVIAEWSGSLGAAPVNCTAIGVPTALSLTLGTNNGTGTPTCSVSAGGPGRHCINFPGCPGGSTGGGSGSGSGSGSENVYVRQPGRTTQCRQACECGCVCDTRARPKEVKVTCSGFGAGYPNPNPCVPYFNGYKFTLPFVGLDGEGNCLYGLDTKDLNYYLLATLGFPGDPSDQGVFARLEFHRNDVPSGTLEYAFELDHLEWQTSNYSWKGPGTFPCPGQSWDLPMVFDYGNRTANSTLGGPCITEDLSEVTCLFETSGEYTGLPSVSCCCGDAPGGGRWQPNLYICIQSVDPACQAYNGMLVELVYDGASGQLGVAQWNGNQTGTGSSVAITLIYSSSAGQWQGGISCGGGTSVPISFPQGLNSSTTVDSSMNPCCSGALTLTLADHPIACGGSLTSEAAGCCGCPIGVNPPNNLLVTLPGTSLVPCINAVSIPCDAVVCDFAGTYVVDWVGCRNQPGCETAGCQCCICTWQGTFTLGQCYYPIQGGPNWHNAGITITVSLDQSGNLSVYVQGNGSSICLPGLDDVYFAAVAPQNTCSFNVSCPQSGRTTLCVPNGAAQVQSL